MIYKKRDLYIQKLIMYIDRGIPVIINNYGKNPNHRYGWSVIVGYSNYGKTLFYIGGDGTEPDAIAKEDLLSMDYADTNENCYGWLFIGEKQEDRSLSVIYRECILSLPQLFSTETALYCLGAKAFGTWADYIEEGYYEHIKSDEFDNWAMYTVYICCLATNSSVNKGFLERALTLNPDLTFIPDIITLYEQMECYWNNDNGSDLEALGGGFNITLDLLQDKNRRRNIVGKLRNFAECTDKVVFLIEQFKQKGK